MTSIETKRLVLREFRDSDVDPLYEIQGDREHMRFTIWAPTCEACETKLRSYASSRERDGFAPWTILRRDDGRVIGWGGLNIDPDAPGWGVEVSYFIHPDEQGQGFASELVRASLRHGFEDLALPEIGAFARPENLASVRVLEKCGFRLLCYEPLLERNHYGLRSADWDRLI
ncbi:MAG: GNAT family N-acetyltransferase [Gaiellaceae bacterium]|jgi:RimJ/RimL family protein N-acetyltransferase